MLKQRSSSSGLVNLEDIHQGASNDCVWNWVTYHDRLLFLLRLEVPNRGFVKWEK